MEEQKNKDNEKNTSKDAAKPDPGTLHTTDPQKHMEGPVSSAMKKTGESFDNQESKEEADDKKEKGM